MQRNTETEADQSSEIDPEKEAAYWREQHLKQPYAKDYSYEQFEHAYRTGYNSFLKYRGRKFAEVEDSIASDYEEAKPGTALPRDTVCQPANSVRETMSGVMSQREPGGGLRT